MKKTKPEPVTIPDAEGRDLPRRCYTDLMNSTEVRIMDAMTSVEGMGTDQRLTRAIHLLEMARENVADFIDGIER